MFETEQEKRYRTFDGQPVHADYGQSLLKDPVIQSGVLVSLFTAAVIAPSNLSRATATFLGGVGGTVLPVLISRWLTARDTVLHFNGHENVHVIDTKPEHSTETANPAITQVSRDFNAAAYKRLRIGAVLGFFAAEPITRIMSTITTLADKTQGQDIFMATLALAFMITQWRIMDLHKGVENNQARIVRTPAPERKLN